MEEQHLSYEYYTNRTKEEIPKFLLRIYSRDIISNRDKQKITEDFLEKYLTNNDI